MAWLTITRWRLEKIQKLLTKIYWNVPPHVDPKLVIEIQEKVAILQHQATPRR